MKKLSTIIFIITAVLLASCVPSSPSKKRKSTSDDSSVKTNGGTSEEPTFDSGEDLYWYSGSKIEGTITLNESTNTVIYLRGQELHDFLTVGTNFSFTYCLVASYQDVDNDTNNEHLRFRAVPISFNNITTGVNEKLLRIDIPESTLNQSVCSGVGPTFFDSSNVAGAAVTDINFSLSDLCPTCSGILPSTNISLYSVNNPTLAATDIVPSTSLDLRQLGMRVDVKNNSGQQTSTCTNSECVAKGFNCCVDGQCVNDGQEKPNASSEPDYAQALADIGINPANFINYPNVFFVCSSNQQVEPTPTPLPDAAATANAQLQLDIQDFNCLEGAKLTTPDYSTCRAIAPSTDQFTLTAFENVRSDVWRRCGCDADPFPTDPDNPQCPDFGLEAIRDVSNNITQVICFTPPPVVDPTPFQNLNLNLSVRSAPHRFFRSNGTAVDDVDTVKNEVPTVEPEGEEFSYLDEIGKTDPINGTFNMNSVLGQFKVDLSRAHPATTVNVELDQTYVIAAVSGFATPCPQCADDAWFNNFSSHPQTTAGNGLPWIGYSTSRNTYQNNLTNGNYEDTIFGRACWLPPTMIPFSHQRNQNAQTQRMNRLATQAAYFVNGYQRDWFGFNKGALIGSFDGVRWFAIGNGRRVTSTTTKLFLAINAPFADLAEPTNILVNIITDFGNNTAADFDFDPNIAPNDPLQNQAATCQYHHQCNVDSDCVSKLGWEYTCADISRYKTRWPKFNSEADETADEEFTDANFNTILQGNLPPGEARRCVYRGAGAPCKQDYTSNLNTDDRELFTCAPNFYCSSLTASDFNREVVRTPNLVESILYGQEADYLGRPLSYLKGSASLTTEIRNNMEHNASIFTSQVGDWGICRPGKRIHPDPVEQHQNNDSQNRTDYISQISSCNSSTTGSGRVESCPVFETEEDTGTDVGNYLRDTLFATTTKQSEQNMCGAESQRTQGTTNISTFEQIEAETLTSINNILNPTLVADACFRRAGSICHTDLDCSPNNLHEEQASFFGLDYFGNTEAEKKFWLESLVCGQAEEEPFPTEDDYFDYDMTKNRCCRAVGNDFTMYTSGDTTVIPDLGGDNTNLITSLLPQNGPTADGRYSRYAVATPQVTGNGVLTTPVAEAPRIIAGQTPKAFQWKTINDTGKKNCCGGGWVRKFADGTTDWANVSRLQMDITNFSCLNYKNDLPFEQPEEVADTNYNQDLNYICRSPADGGCIQNPIEEVSSFEIVYPRDVGTQVGFVTTTPVVPPPPGQPCEQAMTVDGPYIPRYFAGNPEIFQPNDNCRNYLQDTVDKWAVDVYLPTYIGVDFVTQANSEANLVSVEVEFRDASGNDLGTISSTSASMSNPGAPGLFCPAPVISNARDDTQLGANVALGGADAVRWCLDRDTPLLQGTILRLAADPTLFGGWAYAGIRINYKTLNSTTYDHNSRPACDVAGAGTPGQSTCDNGMEPGNALYYLTKLARLELLGVPQIFYEPLYCNSNRSKIVGGIFNTTADTREAFNTVSFDYTPSVNGRSLEEMYTDTFFVRDATTNNLTTANPATDDGSRNTAALDDGMVDSLNGRITFQDNVSLPAIFSGHDFKCCIELDEETPESAKCCSGHSVVEDSVRKCKLPRGANLNVYFNKFISSEGIGDDKPGGGLTEDDFVPETGEPKLSLAVNNKLIALGQAYCESGSTRKGASFGYFNGEPNSGIFVQTNQSEEDSKRFSILDTTNDLDSDNTTGFSFFQQGFRWDHQFYCN